MCLIYSTKKIFFWKEIFKKSIFFLFFHFFFAVSVVKMNHQSVKHVSSFSESRKQRTDQVMTVMKQRHEDSLNKKRNRGGLNPNAQEQGQMDQDANAMKQDAQIFKVSCIFPYKKMAVVFWFCLWHFFW